MGSLRSFEIEDFEAELAAVGSPSDWLPQTGWQTMYISSIAFRRATMQRQDSPERAGA